MSCCPTPSPIRINFKVKVGGSGPILFQKEFQGLISLETLKGSFENLGSRSSVEFNLKGNLS